MAREPKPASADDVRAWAREQGWTDEFNRPVAERGRMPSTLISEFDRAHKRNNVRYMPGYKPQGGAQNASRSTEVATRSTSRSTPAKTPAKVTQQKETPEVREPAARVSSERVQAPTINGGDSAQAQIMSIGDAIAMLQSAQAAKAKRGDKAPTGLLAYYALV